jgi:hypothetical protein
VRASLLALRNHNLVRFLKELYRICCYHDMIRSHNDLCGDRPSACWFVWTRLESYGDCQGKPYA